MATKIVINASWGGFHLTDEMLIWFAANNIVPTEWWMERHNPALVQCVEQCEDVGDLVVIEIDEDRYFIEEYDGVETVYTPKTCPWVYVEEETN